MNKKITIQLKYLLLFLVAFLVFSNSIFNTYLPKEKVVITQKTTIKSIKKEDSITIDLSEKKPIKDIVYFLDTVSNKVRKKPTEQKKSTTNSYLSKKKDTEKQVVAKVFKGSVQLKNAKVVYSVVSPDRIFNIDFSVITNDKEITNSINTKTTKYVIENVWFLNYEPKFSLVPFPAIVGHEISIDFTFRNKFRIGAGFEYNSLLPANNKIIGNFKIGIRL